LASACALAAVQRRESADVLPDLRDPTAGVCAVAAMLVAIAAAGASAAGRRAGDALMRLPSQWFLVVEAIDLRCGMDRLLVWVQQSGGAITGSVGYVFRNRSGSRIKLLLVDATGVWRKRPPKTPTPAVRSVLGLTCPPASIPQSAAAGRYHGCAWSAVAQAHRSATRAGTGRWLWRWPAGS
jgi:hypothetical protein